MLPTHLPTRHRTLSRSTNRLLYKLRAAAHRSPPLQAFPPFPPHSFSFIYYAPCAVPCQCSCDVNVRVVPYLPNAIYSLETTCVRWTGWTRDCCARIGDRVPVTSCVFKVLIPMIVLYLLAVYDCTILSHSRILTGLFWNFTH